MAKTNILDITNGIVFTYSGSDRSGHTHAPYSVLAKNPEELFEAMKSWHPYGSTTCSDVITPNAQFISIINAIFGIGEGWKDCEEKCFNGETRIVRMVESNSWIGYRWNELKTYDIRTTGCGAWGISAVSALAPTLDEHKAIVAKAIEEAKQARIAAANENTAKLRKEFNIERRGWYYVEVEAVCENINNPVRRNYFTVSGYTLADSKMDAYTKAEKNLVIPTCQEHHKIYAYMSEWNSGSTTVEFVGMKTDEGYSVKAWEEYMENQK